MKKAYIKLLAGVLLCTTLSSCLDDSKQALDPDGTQNVIEFLDLSVPSSPAGAVYPAYSSAFAVSPQDQFSVIISYSGPNSNDKDLALTLAVDPTALNQYNKQMTDVLHGTVYEILPKENYLIPNLNVTIPKGETKITVPITVYPNKFDLSKKFAIPLRIVSASSGILSAHFSTAILATVAKNQYDGEYKTNIETRGWTAYGIAEAKPENYPENMGLVTTGPTSVGISNILRGDNLLPGFSIADGATSATGFGDASPIFNFDANNKVVSVDNVFAGNARGRKFVLNPAATATENVFNTTTKTITLNFLFKQDGRPDMTCIWKMTFAKDRG